MSAPAVKTCNFNCTCNREECSFYHHVTDLKDRIKLKAVWDELYDKKKHNETDPEGVRKSVCRFGVLCGKDGCNFKHFINTEGRQAIGKVWNKDNRSNKAKQLVEDIKEKISEEELERLMKLLGLYEKKE